MSSSDKPPFWPPPPGWKPGQADDKRSVETPAADALEAADEQPPFWPPPPGWTATNRNDRLGSQLPGADTETRENEDVNPPALPARRTPATGKQLGSTRISGRIDILPATPLDALPRRAREIVSAGLMPDESVQVVIRGAGNAAIIGTDRRAFIFKRGLTSGATFGHKLASFAYENIVGIEVHTGALTGAVVIHVPGAISVSTSYWQGAKSDPHKAYNAIPIARPYAAAQEGAGELRALIATYTAKPYSPAREVPLDAKRDDEAGGQGLDVIDAIRRLGELRDAGILTADEFESKKAELLSRL